jgi:hypothetical protein
MKPQGIRLKKTLPPPPELPMSDIYGMTTKSNSEIGHIFKVAGTFHL